MNLVSHPTISLSQLAQLDSSQIEWSDVRTPVEFREINATLANNVLLVSLNISDS